MARATRNLPSQFTRDPNKKARMLAAGLFGFIPMSLIGLELADLAARVIEPAVRYGRLHPNTSTGLPPWLHGLGPRWTAFYTARLYWPWHWGVLGSHPDLLLGGLGLGVLAGGLMALVAGRERYVNWGGPASYGKGQYGSAHWRPFQELGQSNSWWTAPKVDQKTQALVVPKSKPGKANAIQTPPVSGLLVGASDAKRPTGGWVLTRDEHSLLMAATRAGKTRRIIIPSIGVLGMAHTASMVVTDPKGEVYDFTADWLRSQGYRILRLDLIEPDPGTSERANPMQPVLDAVDAKKFGKAQHAARELGRFLTFADGAPGNTDPLWINGQISLTAAMILYIAMEAPRASRHLGSVYRTLLALSANEGEALDIAFGRLSPDHPANLAFGPAKVAKDKVRMSFLTSALASLEIFGEPEMLWLTSDQDTDFHTIGAGDQPTAVFLVIPDEDKSRYVVASMIVNQIFRALSDTARAHQGRCPRNVHFLLDEFGNMPAFPDFDSFVTVSAGRGIRLTLVLQNIEQLEKHYDKSARVIRGNCSTWLYLRTADLQSAEELAKISGQYTIQTESIQSPRMSWLSPMGQAVGNSSEGQAMAGRDLVQASEIMRWPENWVWHWQAGKAPAMLPMPDLSAWPCFAPISERHPFRPKDIGEADDAIDLWDGVREDEDGEAPASARSKPKKGGEPVKPEIAPNPNLAKLFGRQPAPIDADDVPDTDTDEA